MESIKKKAKEWCRTHSIKHCTEQCDGCWQVKSFFGCEQHNMELAYEECANLVLDILEKELPLEDNRNLNDYGKALVWRLKNCIEQLKENNLI